MSKKNLRTLELDAIDRSLRILYCDANHTCVGLTARAQSTEFRNGPIQGAPQA
jgi:hypothetical protein